MIAVVLDVILRLENSKARFEWMVWVMSEQIVSVYLAFLRLMVQFHEGLENPSHSRTLHRGGLAPNQTSRSP